MKVVTCIFNSNDHVDMLCPHLVKDDLEARQYIRESIDKTIADYPTLDNEGNFLPDEDDFNEAYVMLNDNEYWQWNIKSTI